MTDLDLSLASQGADLLYAIGATVVAVVLLLWLKFKLESRF